MAYDMAQKAQPKKMQSNLSSFTKFDGESAPDTFLQGFLAEADLCDIKDDYTLMRILPSLMSQSATAV